MCVCNWAKPRIGRGRWHEGMGWRNMNRESREQKSASSLSVISRAVVALLSSKLPNECGVPSA